jgi:hypothetical protein
MRNRAVKPNEPKKPKLTDAERLQRFVEMAKEVGAPEETPDFDEALKRVVSAKPSKQALASKPVKAASAT